MNLGQGVAELVFDAAYLIFAMTIGIYLIVKGRTKLIKMYGVMAVVLAGGDSFHLVPRVYSLLTTGLEANAFALGLGKLITSITMTFFYVLLYFILEQDYKPNKTEKLIYRISVLSMAGLRILLCCFPQNKWFDYEGDLLWGILRNIPFAIMGIVIIVMCFILGKKKQDKLFTVMAWMVILSFGFYIPVVLFADAYPLVGILMIPKTLAYVGVVIIGYLKHRQIVKQETSTTIENKDTDNQVEQIDNQDKTK